MKRAEKEKLISECISEYESTDFPEMYPSTSWKQYRENVRNLYGIIRKFFGKAESKRITVDYFADTKPNTFCERMLLVQTQDALAAVK